VAGDPGLSNGGAHAHAGSTGALAGRAGAAGAPPGGAPGAAGSTSAGSSNGGAGAGGGAPAMSAGCGKAAPLSVASQQTVMIDSAVRSYLLVPPTPYDGNTPYPVVFAYHGSGGSGANFRAGVSFEAAADNQAIFVYPDGAGGIWDLKNNGSDAKLFDSIMSSLTANWCVDSGAVFAIGFSYGGWAATQMARARPAAMRAVVSIEGGGPQGASNSDPAVAAMIIHGTNDTAEPLTAGQNSRDHFLQINGCGSTSSATSPAPCVAYAGCQPKKPVVWCQHEGGHEIPAFTASAIWSFFSGVR